ncbi:MAG: hypothetical protein ACRDVL_02680 [Acidimicrobiia bacterium]
MRNLSPIRTGLVSFGLAMVLAGCGAEGTDSAETAPSTSQPGETTISVKEGDMDLVDQARADLAAHLSVPETDIELISIEAVTWRDGSLGCPEPGKFYTQALVEGHRIVLGYQERVYLYHSGDVRDPFLCSNPDSKDGGYEFVPPPGEDTR